MEYRYYAIQTTAGHENKVRGLIERRIKEDPRAEDVRPIRKALVPVQEVVEIKNGKKVNVERKFFPGYVLVEMVSNQETLQAIQELDLMVVVDVIPTDTAGWADVVLPESSYLERHDDLNVEWFREIGRAHV